MELSDKSICISSYNPTGFGISAVEYLRKLFLFSNIVCLQEHFLQDSGDKKYSNTNKLRKAFPNHDMFIKPAIKDNSHVSRGRAKGGLATIWDRGITKYVSKITCDNFRLQGTVFSFPGGSLLLLNTYFPCDPRKNNFDDTELVGLLGDIENAINAADCPNVLVAGDLNCHIARRTRFTQTIQNFFHNLNLEFLWEVENDKIDTIDYTFLFTSDHVAATSTIDHFICNTPVHEAVAEAGVIHDPDNLSNHSPIFIKLVIDDLNTDIERSYSKKKVNWADATTENKADYKESIADKLNSIQVPSCLHCENLHCHDHSAMIEDYTLEVLEAIEDSAKKTLPSVGGVGGDKKTRKVAGWNEYVKPYHQESKFWHSVWISAGKPLTGGLYSIMRQSKAQYKYAFRRIYRARNKIQNDQFVNGLLEGDINLFDAIKKHRGKVKTCSNTIDGEVGSASIAQNFADIYSKLYNKMEHNEEFLNLQQSLDKRITREDIYEVHRITEDIVKQGLERMKKNKSDAFHDFQSDCLIDGPPELVTHLTNILQLFISHGEVPHSILVCTLVPLVKDNLGDITNSDNYRAIATGSQLVKLLDIVILMLEGDKLGCDQLQFGFQPKASTTMCTWVATAVIDHYNRQGTAVYGCAMDLRKAFDLVEWLQLFKVLEARRVSPVFLRILLYIYRNQCCEVQWSGAGSDRFGVKNGVRQVAVSSPILFSVYIDDLFRILRNAGLDCKIHGIFYGCIGYADDLLLLSASRSGLQSMVDKCGVFASKMNLKFSTNSNPAKSKTKGIIFSSKPRERLNVLNIKLNGDDLPWVNEVKHLGNILENNNSMKRDTSIKKGQFIGKINSMLQEFHYVSPKVFMKLVNVYTTSFHGSNLWNLFSSDSERLYKAWNVAVRMAYKVPHTTHRYLIGPISSSLHLKVMLTSRFVNFVKSLQASTKYAVRVLSSLCISDLRTVVGCTLSTLASICRCDVRALSASAVKKSMEYFAVPNGEQWRVPVLNELLDPELEVPGFLSEEIKEMIDHMCTS